MQDYTFFETGDDTYQGIGFTPEAPGCDQVEVVASLDLHTNQESSDNLEAARRYARLLYAAPVMVEALRYARDVIVPNLGHTDGAVEAIDHALREAGIEVEA